MSDCQLLVLGAGGLGEGFLGHVQTVGLAAGNHQQGLVLRKLLGLVVQPVIKFVMATTAVNRMRGLSCSTSRGCSWGSA